MRLDDDTKQKLSELLRKTTALVYINGQAAETAFFIGEDLLLTCAHVPPGQVEIELYGSKRRAAELVHRDDDADLMLLSSPAESSNPSPCVVLGRDVPDGVECLVAGYPRDDTSGLLKPEVVRNPVHWRGDESLIIEPGQIITWGMSGGPVVSTESGAVVGVVQSSKHARDALGGEAIPISRAAKVFREVADALDGETLVMVPWRNVLGPALWRRLGPSRSWHMGRRIDLWVTGDRRHWEVTIRSAGNTLTHESPDLGEGVAEAIFHWAQRRHPRRVDQVKLLGQLLTRALFPPEQPPWPSWLKGLGLADGVLVRLHIPPGDNELADIPWELTADPFSGERDRFLATDDQFLFTRAMDYDADTSASPEPKPAGDISILTVVAQPDDWEYNDVPGTVVGGHRPWPDVIAIRRDLETGIRDGGFKDVTTLVPATSARLHDDLESPDPYDVLHYIGTGA
ncbi:MAG: trypsin-like peptidase domain-containing protein, partial [Isosphaeraceae bacterium]